MNGNFGQQDLADIFLGIDTAGGQTLTTREVMCLAVDTMHLSNHTTLHKEADTIRSHTEQRHHLMDRALVTMVLNQLWAEITMVNLHHS